MMETLTGDERVKFVKGRVSEVTPLSGRGFHVVLDESVKGIDADAVINCIGFDPFLELRQLLNDGARQYVEQSTGVSLETEGLASTIGADLSPQAMASPLFFPALAPLAQGPGFANLSCLGSLSDRIVGRLVRDKEMVPEVRRADVVLR
jgi:mycobactin lysine-N-oxygenase